jgi:hypothetical protein
MLLNIHIEESLRIRNKKISSEWPFNQSLQVVSNITAAPLASATPLTTAATITASTACLAKPNRGGKSRNVTAHIVKQIRQYELGEETCCVPLSFLPPRYIKLIKLDYKSIALNGVRQAGRW